MSGIECPDACSFKDKTAAKTEKSRVKTKGREEIETTRGSNGGHGCSSLPERCIFTPPCFAGFAFVGRGEQKKPQPKNRTEKPKKRLTERDF